MKAHQLREQKLKDWINSSTDFDCQSLQIVSGDASFRRYFRFVSNNRRIIAVDAPPEFEDCSKFIKVAKSLARAGIKVPDVYAFHAELGFYCQQDFGDRPFSTSLSTANHHRLYKSALSCIPNIQTCNGTDDGPFPKYDDAFVQRELNLFSEWLVSEFLQLNLSLKEVEMLNKTFDLLKDCFLSQPTAGVHRDFHSRNLMLLDNDEIGVIDFQDAVNGPITYDAVSLLRDCYCRWPADLVYGWLKEWHGEYFAEYNWQQFRRWFDLTGMQRHIKASGIFARLAIRDAKTAYLSDIPRTLQYLIDVGSLYSEFAEFSLFIEKMIVPGVVKRLGERAYDN